MGAPRQIPLIGRLGHTCAQKLSHHLNIKCDTESVAIQRALILIIVLIALRGSRLDLRSRLLLVSRLEFVKLWSLAGA